MPFGRKEEIMLKLNIQLFADGKVVIETDLNTKGFTKGLDKMQSLAKTGFKALATATGLVATAMAGALANGVKFNSEIEQLQTSFEVMTGSADKAREVIQKLKKVGAETPYELKGLASTTQLLMQYGFTADDAYKATINLGDIAQGNAEKMNSIALAFGQMSSLGKVTMQDIKQMINAGFNPLQAIAEMTGETMQQVNTRYEEGKISVEEVTKAMQYASSENGKFYKSMEKQSKTLAGQISTLKDNFDSLTGTLSEGLSKTISGQVLPSLNALMQNMETAFTEGGIPALAEAVGNGVADMLTAIVQEAPKFIDVALTIIENLVKGIEKNLPTIVTSAITLVSNFIKAILKMLPDVAELGVELIIELAKGITKELPSLIPLAVDTLLLLQDTMMDNIDLIIETGIDLILALALGLIDALPKLVAKIPEIIIALTTALTKPSTLAKLINAGIQLIIALIAGIIEMQATLIAKGIELILKFIKGLISGEPLKEIKKAGKNLIAGLWDGIQEKWNNLKSKVEGFGKGIVDKFKSVFGIKSPSKVFKEQIGKYLAEGMGVGFEDELDNVYRDMQNAIDFETGKMSANVQTNGTYQMAMSGVPEFNLLDNTNNTTQLVCDGKVLAEVVNTQNKYREVAKA